MSDHWSSPQIAYERDYSKPATDIDAIDLAFPARGPEYAPPEETIPEDEVTEQWLQFQRDWFFKGLPADFTVNLKDGIDGKQAFDHLKVIQGTFGIRHEHKEKAVAYLAGKWFDGILSQGE